MSVDEGVIKFTLEHEDAPAVAATELAELNAWRRILYLLQLIGQDPARYGGYGFGNISRRIAPYTGGVNQRAFVITGTQTGGTAELEPAHYTTVNAYRPQRNLLQSAGPIRPSSESLTHGAVYDLDDAARWVMHAHSPEIWQAASALELPTTAAAVAYGTPAMADEVTRLFAESEVRSRGIFAMGGHEDGIVAFGPTAEAAGATLINTLAEALALVGRKT